MARIGGVVLAASVAICVSISIAEASPATAEQHFRAGLERFDAADYQEALTHLRAAYELEPRPMILLNVAACLVELGRGAEAVRTLEQYLEDDGADPQRAARVREELERLRRDVADRAEPPEPEPATPERVAEATAPAPRPVSSNEPARSPAPAHALSLEEPAPRDTPTLLQWWPYATAAVVLGGVGAYYTVESRKSSDELDAIISNSNEFQYSEAESLERRAHRESVIGTVALGAAGTAVVVSAILGIRQLTRDEPADRDRLAITPVASSQGMSVDVRIAF